MSILSNRIKKERESMHLSREDLSKMLGISYSAIAMYEQGNREPNNDLALKMCEIFNCSLDYLIGKNYYRNNKEYQSAIKYAIAFLEFSDDELKKIIDLILKQLINLDNKHITNTDDFIYTLIVSYRYS